MTRKEARCISKDLPPHQHPNHGIPLLLAWKKIMELTQPFTK